MGKCVVCGKSCGPFNELHKACLPAYQGTRKCLDEKFSNLQEITATAAADIQACKASDDFSAAQFKNLIIEAWQKQARLVVKDPALDVAAAKNLVNVANSFDIQNIDVEEYLLIRLSNIEHLDCLQNKHAIEKSFESAPNDIEFESDEQIVWEFTQTAKNEPQRYSEEKDWTVLRTVMNNVFLKRRYKPLATRTEESGTLFITNQGLHYKNNKSVSNIKYSEIHSITPMKNGVRVQSNHREALPETFVTGDGRFVFALLQYAQGLNG